MLNNCNVTNSDERLLCATASIRPSNDPSKNRLAADHPTVALGHTGVETRISVNVNVNVNAAMLPPHPRCVCKPPTMIFASAGNVMALPPSLMVRRLVTTNDVGSTAAVANCQVC